MGDKGEGQAARWVVDHFWAWSGRGGKRGKGWEAGACHRNAEMQVRASAAPSSRGRFEVPSQARKGGASPTPPLPGLQWTAEQTLTGMSGGHILHRSHEHKQKPRADSLTQDIWLDTDGQRNLEGSVGSPACNAITCPVSWAKYFCRT